MSKRNLLGDLYRFMRAKKTCVRIDLASDEYASDLAIAYRHAIRCKDIPVVIHKERGVNSLYMIRRDMAAWDGREARKDRRAR